MRTKLFHFNHRLFKIIFYLFFAPTLFFALTSVNLILGDNHITKIGTTGFTTGFLLIVIALGIIIYDSKKVRHFFYWLFITHKRQTAVISFVLAILLQIGFILLIHPGIGFDVSGVHEGLLKPNDVNIVGYFSVNPNNLGIFLMQHWFAQLFKQNSWLFFEFVTLFLVDISALFNLGSIAIIDKTRLPLALYIHAMGFITFPAIIVPYTDTWVIPFVSAYLFCYCLISQTHFPRLVKLLAMIVFGIAVSSSYFIKPSAIIPAIAIIIIELVQLLNKQRRHWLWLLLLTLTLAVSTAGSYVSINHTIKNQSYVRVYYFRAKPMIHFINMGLSGDGGYNAKDSFKMVTLIHRQDRIDYSVNSIKKRLHKMGPAGYLAFLWRKHGNNTSDGTFAWLRDGDFVPLKYSPSGHGFKRKVENFVYLYGNNVGDLRFIVQIWWCIWLALIFFGWQDNRKIVQVLRLALVGGFIFLLIFEGGRSRYLIQFLPAFLILAVLNFAATRQKLKDLFAWVH